MFYGLNSGWLLLMIVSTVIGLATQGYINSTFRKWSRVPLESGKSGAQIAREILDANGLSEVGIKTIGGQLTDNYDPRSKTLSLSEPVYGAASVSAAGVAAHESGHAIQDATGYVWGAVRSSLVPVAGFGSNAAWVLIIIGIFLRAAGSIGQTLILLGILLYAAAVLFQLVTLPVEFDASRRAVASLQATGQYSAQQ